MTTPQPADSPPFVEVAAAVILSRDYQNFLLTCRPDGKPYAGYWEFPGGKIEAGEDVKTALIREIHEELGLHVTEASPWITQGFLYPHAFTHVHFWRVTGWEGEISGEQTIEPKAIAWNPINLPCKLTPILPANSQILQMLAMPTQILITHAGEVGIEAEMARIERALTQGIRMILIREQTLPATQRLNFIHSVIANAKSRNAQVILSETGDESESELSRSTGAHGIHLTSAALRATLNRPCFPCVGASCHDAEELQTAQKIGLNYVTLGPVLPTPSHPDHPGLGWEAFAALALNTPIPIYALGGQSRDTLATAQQHGAHGIACMRNL
ncbi:MAG: Nudix family hydrolase [Zoogloeaceae bacterium]|nr:Nudix family hydrolase [Zoogloeaceae bacterium]